MVAAWGYNGLTNCVAIEFDTWYNPEYHDPNNNHCAVQAPLTPGGAVSCDHAVGNLAMNANLPIRFNDQRQHNVVVDYLNNQLTVSLDDKQVINLSLDLTKYITGNSVYIGYTSTTGGAYENNQFWSWDYMPIAIPINIQYRHNNNTMAEASFCDGHVAAVTP